MDLVIEKRVLTHVGNAFMKNDFLIYADGKDVTFRDSVSCEIGQCIDIKAVQEKFTHYDGKFFKYYMRFSDMNKSNAIPNSDGYPPETPELCSKLRITGENPKIKIVLDEEKALFRITGEDVELLSAESSRQVLPQHKSIALKILFFNCTISFLLALIITLGLSIWMRDKVMTIACAVFFSICLFLNLKFLIPKYSFIKSGRKKSIDLLSNKKHLFCNWNKKSK